MVGELRCLSRYAMLEQAAVSVFEGNLVVFAVVS